MLERSRKTLQKDFEAWFATAARQAVAREQADKVRVSKGQGGAVAAVRASQLEFGVSGGKGVAETPRTAAARKGQSTSKLPLPVFYLRAGVDRAPL